MKRKLAEFYCFFALSAGLVSVPIHASETVSYTYDQLGRLIGVARSGSTNNGIKASYCYDRAGNRRRAIVSGVGGASPASVRCTSTAKIASGTDFNGDGIDDLLWRNSTGYLSNWLGTTTGAFSVNDSNAFNTVSLDWKVVGTGDFNGDGRADILWRHTNGDLTNWLGNINGGYIDNSGAAYYSIPTSYKIVGVGDFNGDGFSDILWRSSTGTITDWLGTANGSFQVNDSNSTNGAPLDWNVAGIGDFNGDGRSDIVWRRVNGELSNWLGQPNGGFVSNGSVAGASVETRWTITGVGDFNGDGRSDLLWRSTAGELVDWLGRLDGGYSDNTSNAYYQVGTEWQVVGSGDYNGDGRADILWRKTSGDLTNWLGNTNGSFTGNDANQYSNVPTNWYVQGPSTF